MNFLPQQEIMHESNPIYYSFKASKSSKVLQYHYDSVGDRINVLMYNLLHGGEFFIDSREKRMTILNTIQ